MTARVVVDWSGSPIEHTRWRTWAVFAHTFTASTRVVARSAVGRLDDEDVDRTVRRWCRHVFRLSRTTVTVDGEEHVPAGPVVLLSNHRSLLDIPAVCATFPGRVRFVAKQELRRVPMFGRAMEEAGIVFVDRADRARAIAQLGTARTLIERGLSVWIAAEGGRTNDAALGPLKKGPLHLAKQLGVPLLPTWVEGTERVIPANQLVSVTGQTVQVRYGRPIATDGGLAELEASARAALIALSR